MRFTLVGSGQALGDFASWSVSLADADGDGDLDALVSNWHPHEEQHGRLWLNDGDGTFTEGAQRFPAGQTTMSPGDLDGDGDVDIWFGGHVPSGPADGQVWLNDGHGAFSRTTQSLLTGNSALGDVDGDGDLDSVVVNYLGGVRVYRNDGSARFTPAGNDLEQISPGNLALADLDGDGDLDAFVTSVSDASFVSLPDRVWFNDGNGSFIDSGQALGHNQGIDVALGDVDGDGDIDALVGNAHDAPTPSNPAAPFKLWLNDGSGFFSDSGQYLDESKEGVVSLADLDSDGDLDAVLFNREPITESGPNKVLINHGRGRFGDWGIVFGNSATPGGAVGDLDGDGDLDVFSANAGIPTSQANRVWNNGPPPSFPVQASVLVSDRFQRCEGIAFNGEGDLYVTGNHSLWRVDTDGEVEHVADMNSNRGLARVGDRDLLVVDIGPTNAFDHGPNTDGIVWRISPEGDTTVVATGIGDPNFVALRDDGSFLVSDDAFNEIWVVDTDGTVALFTAAIGHPNGMLISEDGNTLYVAQTFTGTNPIGWDNRIWSLQLEDGEPAGAPELLYTTGDDFGPHGLAMDALGRIIYVAVNLAGTILRVDPSSGSLVLIAENLPGVAGLAFGQGDFDRLSIYATSTQTGKVWNVPVGVAGAQLHP